MDDRPARDTDDDLQRQIDALSNRVDTNRADIDALAARAAASEDRADGMDARSDAADRRAEKGEARADAAEERAVKHEARADAAEERADRHEARTDAQGRRLDELERRVDVDQEMIAELQAEGVLSRQHAEQMHEALRSSRRIGAAIGVVMANRQVNEEAAFLILAKASSNSNRKLRDIAEEIVRDLDVSHLPRV
jgi:hypothetical protein